MFLVTGATGNVGREVVSELLAAGRPTRVFSRDPRKVSAWRDMVDVAIGDLTEPESFAGAMQGVQAVFLLAAGSADQFEALLRAANSSASPRVVFVSGTVAEFSGTRTGAWFREREDILRRSGLAWTILRPCDFMTNTLQWASSIRQAAVVHNPTGDAKDVLIAPEDVAGVVVKCLASSSLDEQILPLSGGESLSVPEQVEILAGALHRPIRCVEISLESAVKQLIDSGMSQAVARSAGEIYEMIRRGEAASVKSDFAKIMGRNPKNFSAWAQEHAHRFE
ncbi:MAG TPA: NAD(P)H-binding protein [Candidatus Dormibacteraeota bacterium]|nr:NAD(P)H-binding protein [Candidatus Dormibacteraeota bacterium]